MARFLCPQWVVNLDRDEPPLPAHDVCFAADCVAKVESCSTRVFRENKRRESIADSYTLYRVAEVAGEFNAR